MTVVAFGWIVTSSPTLPGEAVVQAAAKGDRGQGLGRGEKGHAGASLDQELADVLADNEFTGTMQSQIEPRLGRPINQAMAELGRLLWFDNAHSLHQDNTCGGCHGPGNAMGDSQPIAIGVDSNRKVGPHRTGPRNQRRAPSVINNAFYPKLMWNGRFSANHAISESLGDPFDNVFGFKFPDPEGDAVMFPPSDPVILHLLQAQAFIPPTELVEVAGFTGTCPSLGPDFCQFDNGVGLTVPPPDGSGFRNEPIRQKGLDILNGIPAYRQLFAAVFPEMGGPGGLIDFSMFGRAIAEFEFALIFANAPLDRFARGDRNAMTTAEKRGALVFFDESKGNCVACHAVKGRSNEMFSDFANHVAGIPQIAPFFGVGKSNMIYDGPNADEDFGQAQVSGDPSERYQFRTAPLRNLALAPAFFHNGAFADLGDAIRFHLDAVGNTPKYNAKKAGVPKDLQKRQGPSAPVLAVIDPLLASPVQLTKQETKDLIDFVRTGLLDPGAMPKNLCSLIPKSVPSGLAILDFEACHNLKGKK
ncbi:MAG: hypothetical protein FJW23_16825 [Acidimicrobiia bacterium]|nr:hypothetical protein [Acidimicrobiia bacterium]